MENAFDAVSQLVIFIASAVCFFILIKTLIPAFSLKPKYSFDGKLGRGYKKYKYPSGRAVAYEPHPSIRKFINKYLLFVNDGYKYFKCRVDSGVKNLKFEVVMLNNRDKVIDVLSVKAAVGASSEIKEILLHQDTSYVALNLTSVNGEKVKKSEYCCYTVRRLLLYFLLVFAATFLQSIVFAKTLGAFLSFVTERNISLMTGPVTYLFFSIVAATLAVLLTAFFGVRKGIGVSFNGKK